MGVYVFGGTSKMLAILDIQRRKVEGLKARRKALFEYFEKNPNDTHLVLEIKVIDDEIAEYVRQMQDEKINWN
jgi:hypothetical protein